jgi:hypothetical protein
MQKKIDFTLSDNESLPFKTMIIHDVPSCEVLKKLLIIQRSYPSGIDAKGKPVYSLRPYRQLNVELLIYDKKTFTIVYNARLKIHMFYDTSRTDIELHDTRIELDKDTMPNVKEQIMNELSVNRKFIDDKFAGLVVPWSTILEHSNWV